MASGRGRLGDCFNECGTFLNALLGKIRTDSSAIIGEAEESSGDIRGRTMALTEAASRDVGCCVRSASSVGIFGVATRTLALVHILVLAFRPLAVPSVLVAVLTLMLGWRTITTGGPPSQAGGPCSRTAPTIGLARSGARF